MTFQGNFKEKTVTPARIWVMLGDLSHTFLHEEKHKRRNGGWRVKGEDGRGGEEEEGGRGGEMGGREGEKT